MNVNCLILPFQSMTIMSILQAVNLVYYIFASGEHIGLLCLWCMFACVVFL